MANQKTRIAIDMISPAITSNEEIVSTFSPIESPSFTGTPKVPTATTNNSSTQIANTQYVKTCVPKSIGDTNTPVYTNANGVVTATDATIGSNTKPIYMNNGNILASDVSIGSNTKPIYMTEGTITESNASIGGTAKPIYMESGTIKPFSTTIGAAAKPVYVNGGTITAFSGTIGDANIPVYVNGGTITSTGKSFANYLPLAGGTITGPIFKNDSSITNNKVNVLWGQVGTNDQWAIRAGATASDAGYLEIATGDNGNDPIYFRQYAANLSNLTASPTRTLTLLDASGNTTFPGTVTANRLTGAYYADYAEWFPKGEETEPGDVIVLDMNSNNEQYVKSTSTNKKVVGVHSDNWSHIIGGLPDTDEENRKYYIPVSLAGRIGTKVVGPVHKGDYLVPSEIPGVARTYNEDIDKSFSIFGMLVEEDDLDFEIRRLKVKLL